MAKKVCWEILEDLCSKMGTIGRLKVPGGWLVSSINHNGPLVSFIPDPYHEWLEEK